AKVGSNAVVVKDVPAGATAVGIPARILDGEVSKQRDEMAEKIGFSAYAVSDNQNDPMTKAIHALLDHATAQDLKLQEVMQQLNKLGADVESDADVGKAFDVDAFKKL
ncbi:MAG: Serine acetyltransferase, partial [Pseudomonadota bacterium]